MSDEPDWFEKLDRWMLRFPVRAALYLLVAALIVRTKCASNINEAQAQQDLKDAAIRRHMAWLKSLPNVEKQKWPVSEYCHLATAPYGSCTCDTELHRYHSEVTWPERLESGDIACHAQK